ncbi:hypothetical protein MNAN1_003146 [Malassezia nana]|uniref:MATE efflux family protein n=1 Tax=Malassezia nana TaxID=180528 RepID=A0AAF0ELB3_9BASI|nr:hypothetical protein MNAN1_003146 [Malassezia nana]
MSYTEEETPLLGVRKTSTAQLLAEEMLLLTKRAIPASTGYMLQNSIPTVSIAIVSLHGDDLALSAAAHGYMIALVTGWVVALGGSTALDTLAAAAFTRAQTNPNKHARKAELKQVGVLLQRAVVLLLALFACMALLWIWSESILLALGQPRALAALVQQFLRVLVGGAPGYIAFECIKKFCQVQGDMLSSTLVLVAMLPVNVLLNVALVQGLGFGLLGSPMAVSLVYYLSAGLLILYVGTIGRTTTRQAWGGWTWHALDWHGVIQFYRLAIPGILMVGTEWIAFEIVALLAARCNDSAMAAQSVIMTMDQVLNALPFGLGVASSSRLGNLLGMRSCDLRLLRISAQAAPAVATVMGLLAGTVLLFVRRPIGQLFSDTEATIDLVANVLPLVAAFQVFDGWAGSCGGVLRGMGRQHLGANCNLVAYYVVALPLGYWLAFHTDLAQGLYGLWTGQVVALGLVGAGEYVAVTWGTDWDEQHRRANARADPL